MKILITENYDKMSEAAFSFVKEIITENPDAVLGLATGSTPIGLYDLMVRDFEQNGTSYKGIRSVNLDEYVGLSADNVQSYAYFMKYHLFDKVDIDKNNTHLPCGTATDKKAECKRYNELLKKLVPDVQILGIGSNGHIGFNEPGTDINSVTHVVNLTESTIKDNSRLFDRIEDVPRQAFSMGIKNILNSKKIIVMASGENKAKAIRAMIEGPVSSDCPASFLREHNDVIVIVDKAAGKLIK